MFCPTCGSEIMPNAVVCVKCGCPISNQPQNNAYNQNNGYNNYNAYNQNNMQYNNGAYYNNNAGGYAYDDFASGGLKFLCFMIPLIGFILYATETSKRPNKAKSCLTAALWGFGIGLISSFIVGFLGAFIYYL